MKSGNSFSSQNAWLSELQANGYRITAPLKVVVNIMVNASRAMSVIEIYDLGRLEYPSMGLVTVYRSIDKLLELGLIQRVHHEDGCLTFLRANHGHEHILLCTRCGEGFFFEGDDLANLISQVARKSGFVIQDHWLQLHGLCTRCQ